MYKSSSVAVLPLLLLAAAACLEGGSVTVCLGSCVLLPSPPCHFLFLFNTPWGWSVCRHCPSTRKREKRSFTGSFTTTGICIALGFCTHTRRDLFFSTQKLFIFSIQGGQRGIGEHRTELELDLFTWGVFVFPVITSHPLCEIQTHGIGQDHTLWEGEGRKGGEGFSSSTAPKQASKAEKRATTQTDEDGSDLAQLAF